MDIEQLSHLPAKKHRELQRVTQVLFEECEDALKTKVSEPARPDRQGDPVWIVGSRQLGRGSQGRLSFRL